MSAEPPTGDEKTTLVTTECPVPTCPFVAVFEFDGDPYVGALEVRDHCNEEHEPWEIPDDDFANGEEVGPGGDR